MILENDKKIFVIINTEHACRKCLWFYDFAKNDKKKMLMIIKIGYGFFLRHLLKNQKWKLCMKKNNFKLSKS